MFSKRIIKKWDHGFLRIFTVAFLLFQAPAGGSNPVEKSLTLNNNLIGSFKRKIINYEIQSIHASHEWSTLIIVPNK